MDPFTRLPEYLAENLLALRKTKGMSQEQLAQSAQIPRSTITNIESGASNPSLLNLAKISSALQVGIEELLSKPRSECVLLAADEVTLLKKSQGRVRIAKLLPDRIRGLEVDRMEIDPEASMAGTPHLAGAKEYLTLLQGEITVYVAGEKYRVGRGAVFAFPGDQPHSYRCSSTATAIAISIVVPKAIGL
jgi:transcriptional regulator with XRE-family HTH domain